MRFLRKHLFILELVSLAHTAAVVLGVMALLAATLAVLP
jgi:hypothetical protein